MGGAPITAQFSSSKAMTFSGKSGPLFHIEHRNVNTSLTDFEIDNNKYKGVL